MGTYIGNSSSETIRGSSNDDDMFGVGGNDTLHGLGGNDLLSGGSGNDTLNGGGGSDLLYASIGDDFLNGGAGIDTLLGQSGNDIFFFAKGEAQDDVVTGFVGNGPAPGDTLQFSGYGSGATFSNINGDWAITYNGGAEVETIELTGVSTLDKSAYTFIT